MEENSVESDSLSILTGKLGVFHILPVSMKRLVGVFCILLASMRIDLCVPFIVTSKIRQETFMKYFFFPLSDSRR